MPKLKLTTARKYLDALARGSNVRPYLQPDVATWHQANGATVVSWADGSCVYVHVGTGKMYEVAEIETAKRKAAESIGDTKGLRV